MKGAQRPPQEVAFVRHSDNFKSSFGALAYAHHTESWRKSAATTPWSRSPSHRGIRLPIWAWVELNINPTRIGQYRQGCHCAFCLLYPLCAKK